MKKILVVYDEKDVLFMLEKRLAAEGYSVITATNGTDALMLAKSQHPDLIPMFSFPHQGMTISRKCSGQKVHGHSQMPGSRC